MSNLTGDSGTSTGTSTGSRNGSTDDYYNTLLSRVDQAISESHRELEAPPLPPQYSPDGPASSEQHLHRAPPPRPFTYFDSSAGGSRHGAIGAGGGVAGWCMGCLQKAYLVFLWVVIFVKSLFEVAWERVVGESRTGSRAGGTLSSQEHDFVVASHVLPGDDDEAEL